MTAEATPRGCQCWLQDGVNSVTGAVYGRVQFLEWHFFQDEFL